MVQEQVFLAENKSLQSKGVVSPNSKLRNLNPFIDSDGLLRVGGRLSNSDLPYVNKHPAILPGNHNLTVQIIVHFHRKNLHTGASSLLHYPTPCYLSLSQLMGNLPRDRVVPDYPFNCSGVDFCGPFMISSLDSPLVYTIILAVERFFNVNNFLVGGMHWDCHMLILLESLKFIRSVIRRLGDQLEFKDHASKRPVPGQSSVTTPAGDSFLALSC
ncbi:integrase catalytic domain-containing protein [Trichonephila clavipes]|nr:integrase catalytic domain-containing protein [Trichonephila clavipes]